MANRYFNPVPQGTNGAATSLPGAKLFFYINGTTTLQNTYSDPDLTSANANPVVADGNGRFGDIFLLPASYTVVLKDANDVQQWSRDDVNGDDPPIVVDSYTKLRALTGMTTGTLARVSAGTGIDGLFRYDSAQLATDNGGTIIEGWVRIDSGSIQLPWFESVGDGVADDTTAWQNALAVSGDMDTGMGETYLISDQIVLPIFTNIRGHGSTIVASTSFTTITDPSNDGMFTNSGYATAFNSSTANFIKITNLNFTIARNNSSIPSKVIKFSNVKGGGIENCTISMTSSTNITNTGIWLAGCIHDFDIHNNEISNNCQASPDGGGCVWISGINNYSTSADSITRNISVTENNLYQNSDDDAFVLFGRQGIMDGITFKGNRIETGASYPAVVVCSLHGVLDFTPDVRVDSTAYSLGDKIVPSVSNGYYYVCTTAGTTASSEGTLYDNPYYLKSVTDGTAVFATVSAGPWNVDFSDNIFICKSSPTLTIRVGRSLADDANTLTKNIFITNNEIQYTGASGNTAQVFVFDDHRTQNIQANGNQIYNPTANYSASAINGADFASQNNVTGRFTNPIIAEHASGNTVEYLEKSGPGVQGRSVSDTIVIDSSGSYVDVAVSNTGYDATALLFTTEGGVTNLCGNSNVLNGSGWTGSGGFTTFTNNYANGPYRKMEAARFVNSTGSNKTVTYTTGAVADGQYTAFISVKGTSSKGSCLISLISSALSSNNNSTSVFYFPEKWVTIPVSYTKATGGSDAVTFSITVFTGSDLLLSHAQINSGYLSPYCWTTGGNAAPKSVSATGGAAPTTGTWNRGDKVYNNFPTVDGNNMVLSHWVCTVSGSPGTWVAQYLSTVTPAT